MTLLIFVHLNLPFGSDMLSPCIPFIGVIADSICSYYPNQYICWFIQDIFTPNECVSGADILNYFGISFLCQFGSLRICFVNFLPVFDRQSMFKIFCLVYILVVFNHEYILIFCPLKGVGWQFTDIESQAIISCQPLLNRYT